MTMLAFMPDRSESSSAIASDTALFVGVRGDPALESTQLRWQVRLSSSEFVRLEDGGSLNEFGGALFITTKEPLPEPVPGASPEPIGWLKWIAAAGRRSFQIQLRISRTGFDRVCGMAENARYPAAMLTFADEGFVVAQDENDQSKKLWNNTQSRIALIGEYTLRYDLPPVPDRTAA